MPNPLNPQLYDALCRSFRDVRIANEGQPFRGSGRRQSPAPFQRCREEVRQSGEYYRVCCCYCGDRGYRLWVNHMFGVCARETGDRRLWLATCYNERCMRQSGRARALYERLFPYSFGAPIDPSTISPVTSSERLPAPMALPSALLRLDDPRAFRAHCYLQGRGFDIAELHHSWGLAYCTESATPPPYISDSLVIPVWGLAAPGSGVNGSAFALAGWQARRPFDAGAHSAKYLSAQGMRKSQLLYGLPLTLNTRGVIVVVEGPTDVWRLGSNSVALFGKTLSNAQANLILRHFHGRPVVVMLDADAQGDAREVARTIWQSRREYADPGQVVIGHLPPGRGDVGECTREEARAAVMNSLQHIAAPPQFASTTRAGNAEMW